MWAPISACRGDSKALKNAIQSFPSGHTGSAFTVMIFLALYLNAKLKAFSDSPTAFWKMMAVIAPVLGAGFAAATLVIDQVSSSSDMLSLCSEIMHTFEIKQHIK